MPPKRRLTGVSAFSPPVIAGRRMVLSYSPTAMSILVWRQGDADGNGVVNIDDLVDVITAWGDCDDPPGLCLPDMNNDGTVNIDDLVKVITSWSS